MPAFRISTTEQFMSFNVNIKAVEGIEKEYLSPTMLYLLSFPLLHVHQHHQQVHV